MEAISTTGTGQRSGSLVLFSLSVLSLSLALLVGAWLVSVIVKHKTDPAFAGESFSEAEAAVSFAAIGLGLITLLLGLLPGWLIFRSKKRRRDLMSLRVASISLVLLALWFLIVLFGLDRWI
jgi:hypothetical protein